MYVYVCVHVLRACKCTCVSAMRWVRIRGFAKPSDCADQSSLRDPSPMSRPRNRSLVTA